MSSEPDIEYLPVPAKIPRETATELAKLTDLFTTANDVKIVGVELLEGVLGKRTDSNYALVAYILFAKAFKTFQAAQILCLCGYGSDALSLCASLFENVIDLLYIGKAPVRRSLRYMQYEQVAKFLQIEQILKKKRLPRGRRKAYLQYRHVFAPQTAKLLKHFKNDKGWSCKSLYARARALGRLAELDYQEHYWIYCGHKHTLPMAVSGWTVEVAGGTDVTHGPDTKEVFNGLTESVARFLQLSLIIDDAFALSLRPRIDKLLATFRDASASIAQRYPELLK
jgi:uncharacterized protein DUF5677